MGGGLSKPSQTPGRGMTKVRQWIAEGDRFLSMGVDRAAAAIECYERAIECGKQTFTTFVPDCAHLLGWAWMNHGNAWMLYDTADSVARAIDSFQRAEPYFLHLNASNKDKYLIDAGALYANLGQAYFRLGNPDSMAKVLDYYEQANAILKRLPWESNRRYRHHLAALWMNRGNLYWAPHTILPRDEAVRCFRLAIGYGMGLSTKEAPEAMLLANMWTNYGNLLKDSDHETDHQEAVLCYIRAICLLESHTQNALSATFELAAVLSNLANLRAETIESERQFEKVVDGAYRALLLLEGHEHTHQLAAQISLQARRALCQAYGHWLYQTSEEVQADLYQDATDAVDEALALIRFWEQVGQSFLRPLASRFFRLGEQLYRQRQPRFLAEFILETLDPARSPGSLHGEAELMTIARESLQEAITYADQHCYYIDETADTSDTLEIYRSYQYALERLDHIEGGQRRK